MMRPTIRASSLFGRPVGPARRRAQRVRRGFTVLELVVVLAIIALLAGGATLGLMATLGRAKVSATKTDMQTVAQAINAYSIERGSLPPDLQALVEGQFLSKPSDIEDAWGQPFVYQIGGTIQGRDVAWLLVSAGENQVYEGEGGGDDIFLAPNIDPIGPGAG